MKKNLGFSATDYAAAAGFDSDWRDSWWNQDYLELLSRRWGLESVREMLDVGCGAGHWGQRLSTLLEPGAEIVGVDHEEGFLDAARKRADGRPHRFTYRRASAEALPFEDASFDLVTCQTVLIHVPDAERALEEMVRVLRPKGLLVVAEPNNLVNALVNRVAIPTPPFDETLRLLAFEERCLRGKRALGQGDGTIGERLGALFSSLGLEDVRSQTNEPCAPLTPPYETPEEQTHLSHLRGWVEAGMSRWGDEDKARQLFVAGGGLAAEFDTLWALEMRAQRRLVAEIDAGRLVWGGGFLLYVAKGRKP